MSEGYILNAVQTPALLRPVYTAVRNNNTTTEAIKEATGLDSNAVQQATTGLRYVHLLGQEEGEYYVTELEWSFDDPQFTFQMAMLRNLAKDFTPGDWGTQAVVLLNYQYLLQENIQHFSNDDKVLYDAINEWHRSEMEYVPTSQQGEINLNKPKFVNWSRIVEYLGLVHKASGREHTVYPDPRIIKESVKLSVADDGSDGRIEIETYLQWLRENLLPVSLTSDGSIPAPLARILYNLVRDGDIKLVEYGDAGAVSLARTPRRDGIAPDANTIEVVQE